MLPAFQCGSLENLLGESTILELADEIYIFE